MKKPASKITLKPWKCKNPDCKLGMVFVNKIGVGWCIACKGGTDKK